MSAKRTSVLGSNIEIEWGEGVPVEQVGEYVEGALELATYGLDYLDIHPATTKKANIFLVDDDPGGSASSKNDFSLFLKDGWSKRIGDHFPFLTIVSLHELLHTIWFERFPKGYNPSYLYDMSVTEGISHIGEHEVAKMLLNLTEQIKVGSTTIIDKYRQPSLDIIGPLLAQLDKDAVEEQELAENHSEENWKKRLAIYDKWRSGEKGLGLSGALGIQLVDVMLSRGATLDEAIETPSSEIIIEGKKWYEKAA